MTFREHEAINTIICDFAARPGGNSNIIGVPGYTVGAGLGLGLGGGAMWRSSVGWRGLALRRFDARSSSAEVSGGAQRRRSANAPSGGVQRMSAAGRRQRRGRAEENGHSGAFWQLLIARLEPLCWSIFGNKHIWMKYNHVV